MRKKSRGCVLPVFVIVCAITVRISAQGHADNNAATARDELAKAFQAESKLGTHIFYTQSYKVHRRPVSFQGSIFGQIQDVHTDGCQLVIKTTLVDHYSGSIGEGPVRQTESEYNSTIQFMLATELAAKLQVVTARPVRQLSVDSHAVCTEDPQCKLTWIKLKTDSAVIHLTEFTNDVAEYDGEVKDFDGRVNQFWLPVSSTDAGIQLVARMQAYAQTCAN